MGSARSIAELHQVGVEAFTGTFLGIGDPAWNTPDRQRPTRDEFQSTSARLYRPLLWKADKDLVGTPDEGSLIIRGGSLGCDSIQFDDDERFGLTQGSSYVAVAMPILNSVDKPSGKLLLVAAWPIEKDGVVHTEADGDRDVATVADALAHGPKWTPEPQLWTPEPEPSNSGG